MYIGGSNLAGSSPSPKIQLSGNDGTASFAAGQASFNGNGVLDIQSSGSLANASTLLRAGSSNAAGGANAFLVTADGGTSCKGMLDVNSNALEQSGCRLHNGGIIQARRDGGVARSFEIFNGGNAAENINAYINNNGSSYFASDMVFGQWDANNLSTRGAFIGAGGGIDLRNAAKNTLPAFTIQGGTGTADQETVFGIRTDGLTSIKNELSAVAGNFGNFINVGSYFTRINENGIYGELFGQSSNQPARFPYGIGDGSGSPLTVFGDLRINTGADDDANYTSTTDSEGMTTRVYNGPTLDVGERLSKADAALQTLKTAAAAASDFASLKAAIATALADI